MYHSTACLDQIVFIRVNIYIFQFFLYMVTLQIDFVMYSQIHFINDFKILNYAIAEKYINKNNNESIFQYYEVIQF